MDWKSVIAYLQANGYTQPQIAEACECAQSTISDIANGLTKRPRYEIGACLISLKKKAERAAAKAKAKARAE